MSTPEFAAALSHAGQSLLQAIDVESELAGTLIATKNLRQRIQSAEKVFALPPLNLWVTEGVNLHAAIRSMAEFGNQQIAAAVNVDHVSQVYKLFAAPGASTLGTVAADRVNASIGLMAVIAAIQQRTISADICASFSRLHRAGATGGKRHHDWFNLADNFPTDLAGVEQWAAMDTDPSIRRLMLALKQALAHPILEPMAIAGITRSRKPDLPPAQKVPTDAIAPAAAPVPEPNATDDDAKGRNDTLIGWLRARSDQAGYLSRSGADRQWDKQTLPELKVICCAVREVLQQDHPERTYGFLATVMLASSLPAKLAVTISLGLKPDLSLDITNGRLRWYLLRLLDPDVAASTPAESLDQSNLIEIWLPELAWKVGLGLLNEHPDAADVLELILGHVSDETRDEFLTGFRAWLRSIGPGSLHGAEDARYARSLGHVHRALGGDVVAALLSLDFDEVALGTMHYLTLPLTFLHRHADAAWQLVGLGPATPAREPDRLLGSGLGLTPEQLEQKLQMWEQRVANLVQLLTSTSDLRTPLNSWNELVALRLLLTIFLEAGRGDHLERLTWGSVFGHHQYMLLADKDSSEYSKDRLVPIVRFARMVLDDHVRDLHVFCERANSLGLRIEKSDGSLFNERKPSEECFYQATISTVDGCSTIERQQIARADVEALAKEIFSTPLNGGRHTLISMAVLHHLDPPLIKTLAGHQRGMAEVYSDGQWIAPIDGLQLLANALDWMLSPLYPRTVTDAPTGVLKLQEWIKLPPVNAPPDTTTPGQFARILPRPFCSHTIQSMRLIDMIRLLLLGGDGPEHPGASLLVNYLAISWIALEDVKLIFCQDKAATAISSRSVAEIWSRPECRAEIHRPLIGPSTISHYDFSNQTVRPTWAESCSALATWLRIAFPNLDWSDDYKMVVKQLDACVELWMRINVPPFLLTAASSRVTAPTASLPSFLRLISDPLSSTLVSQEKLIARRSNLRSVTRVKLRKTPLSIAIDKVHEVANSAKTKGEAWERMALLRKFIPLIVASDHLPAETFCEYVLEEARLWIQSEKGKLKPRSLSTYTSHLKPGLMLLRPDDDMRLWAEEWFDFEKICIASAVGTSDTETKHLRRLRKVALHRFFRTLAKLGYNIPAKLLYESSPRGHDGMRRSAAATLPLQQDQESTTRLVVGHFEESPLKAKQARVFCDLHWAFSSRAAEKAVLGLDAVTPFDELVIFPDGFDVHKSDHAKRFGPIDPSVVDNFRATAATVASARPGAKWIFLEADRHDWHFVNELEHTFAAAFRQVTRDKDARPHASRQVAPINHLFPGWEDLLRKFLNGQATTGDCVAFCTAVRSLGFNALVTELIGIGHGHPNTFIKYYFALWDLLLSVYAQASLSNLPIDAHDLAVKSGTTVSDAYRQAARRAKLGGTEFDGWMWATTYRPAAVNLTALPQSPLSVPTKALKHSKPSTSITTPREDATRQVMYLALRLAGLDPVPAADFADLATSVASRLEQLVDLSPSFQMSGRRQFRSPLAGGQKAELKYLRSPDGWTLVRKLVGSPAEAIRRFAEALTPMRNLIKKYHSSHFTDALLYAQHPPVHSRNQTSALQGRPVCGRRHLPD